MHFCILSFFYYRDILWLLNVYITYSIIVKLKERNKEKRLALLSIIIRYDMVYIFLIIDFSNVYNNGTFSVSLQGVVYQLDAALESVETQKHGLVFIYDMSDSKYQNFDYDLSQKILTLLKVSVYVCVISF